jgi:hypothetical protein
LCSLSARIYKIHGYLTLNKGKKDEHGLGNLHHEKAKKKH